MTQRNCSGESQRKMMGPRRMNVALLAIALGAAPLACGDGKDGPRTEAEPGRDGPVKSLDPNRPATAVPPCVGGTCALPGADWWKKLATHIRFYPKNDQQTLNQIAARLDELSADGYRVVEIFAPFHSGPTTLWAGLAPVDYYATDPSIGTLSDFSSLVTAAHERGMAVIIFHNLGYFYRDSPLFEQVEQDVRDGIDSPQSRWFLWSDDGQTPVPLGADSSHFFNQGEWVYSDVAEKYFFSRWAQQPQMNWATSEWQQEASNALRFWLDLGIDGMLIDAPNWYLNYDWAINSATVTDVIAEYPNQYANPEGASAFDDDPVPWITRGRWTGLQDFSLQTYWDNEGVIPDAIEAQDVEPVELALSNFRDKVVAAGGVTKAMPLWERVEMSRPDRLLEMATIVAAGSWFSINGNQEPFNGATIVESWPEEDQDRVTDLVQLLANTPALQPASDRRRLTTDAGSRAYALQRHDVDSNQQVIAVLNYSGGSLDLAVDLPDAQAASGPWRDLLTDAQVPTENGRLLLSLDGSGYAFVVLE